jgi:hypothetical protein
MSVHTRHPYRRVTNFAADFMKLVVGFADAFNVDYLKASTLHHSPKLKVRFGSVESMYHPLYLL